MTVTPALNQVKFHVGMGVDPESLKSYSNSKGIVTMAYSPLGDGTSELVTGELVTGIGKAHNATGAQVSMRWLIENGVPFSTKTTKESHMKEDLDIFGFQLVDAEKSQLDNATSPSGKPSFACSSIETKPPSVAPNLPNVYSFNWGGAKYDRFAIDIPNQRYADLSTRPGASRIFYSVIKNNKFYFGGRGDCSEVKAGYGRVNGGLKLPGSGGSYNYIGSDATGDQYNASYCISNKPGLPNCHNFRVWWKNTATATPIPTKFCEAYGQGGAPKDAGASGKCRTITNYKTSVLTSDFTIDPSWHCAGSCFDEGEPGNPTYCQEATKRTCIHNEWQRKVCRKSCKLCTPKEAEDNVQILV